MKSSFYVNKTAELPQSIKNLIKHHWPDKIELDLSLVNINDIPRLIECFDKSKENQIKDVNFGQIYLRCSFDFSNLTFENCKFSQFLSTPNLKNTTFKNCNFDSGGIDNPTNSNCHFTDCKFGNVGLNDFDLQSVKWTWKNEQPKSSSILFSDNKYPDWYVKNLWIQAWVNSDFPFSSNEKKLLNLTENGDSFVINCPGKFITKSLARKIIDNLDETQSNCFDGIDFSDFVFPEIDLSSSSWIGCNLANAKFNSGLDCSNFSFANLQNADFENADDLNFCDFEKSLIFQTKFGMNGPDSERLDNAIKEKTVFSIKGDSIMSKNGSTIFSKEQLDSIKNYSAAVPAVVELARKGLKKLLRQLLTKAGKSKSMISSYIKVVFDALDNFKEEASQILQLIVGFVCANLHKVGDIVGITETSFLKFLKSDKIQAFGEYALANGKGSIVASLLNRLLGFGEGILEGMFATPELARIVNVIEHPESASRIVSSDKDEESEDENAAEQEVSSAKKTRKHS